MGIFNKIKQELRAIGRGTVFGIGMGGMLGIAGLVAGAVLTTVFPVPVLLVGALGAASGGFLGMMAGYSDAKNNPIKPLNDNIPKVTNKDTTKNVEKSPTLGRETKYTKMKEPTKERVTNEPLLTNSQSTKVNTPVLKPKKIPNNYDTAERIAAIRKAFAITNKTINQTGTNISRSNEILKQPTPNKQLNNELQNSKTHRTNSTNLDNLL